MGAAIHRSPSSLSLKAGRANPFVPNKGSVDRRRPAWTLSRHTVLTTGAIKCQHALSIHTDHRWTSFDERVFEGLGNSGRYDVTELRQGLDICDHKELNTQRLLGMRRRNADTSTHFMELMSWNVGSAIKRKLGDIAKAAGGAPVICLQEVAVTDANRKRVESELEKEFPGYRPIIVPRRNCRKASGGVATLVREDFANMVETVESKEHDWKLVIRLQIPKRSRKLTIFNVYIPPQGSKYNRNNEFEVLLGDVRDIGSEGGGVLMLGDLNARIANGDGCWLPALRPFRRNSRDTTRRGHARGLTKLLREGDLAVLNGRTHGDLRGEFTHYTKRYGVLSPVSVVDYALADTIAFADAAELRVGKLDPNVSLHVPQTVTIARNSFGDVVSSHDCIAYAWMGA